MMAADDVTELKRAIRDLQISMDLLLNVVGHIAQRLQIDKVITQDLQAIVEDRRNRDTDMAPPTETDEHATIAEG
jgi:hypothetical protein